jgi:hypothetical protein
MDFNPDSPVTPAEYEVFAKLTASLKEQLVILNEMKNPSVHFAVRKKLETFAGLLEEFTQLNSAVGGQFNGVEEKGTGMAKAA